ncbi:hypothetical protein Tco_0245608 [Tanacetum coccineum]
MCLRQDSSRLDVAEKFIFQSSRYVVPTGRVVVPTGRYVVPAGKVIIIVSPGRLSLVPTGRILSPGLVLPCTLVVSFPAGYMVFLLVAHCYYWSLVVTAGSSRFVLALQTVSIGCVTFLLVVCAG